MTAADSYQLFLEAKVRMAASSGFEVDLADLHPSLIERGHQGASVQWAARGGRRAIFAAFGLGKTRMQLELMRLVRAKVGGASLIVAPLGVRQEFFEDARALGQDLNFIRHSAEAVEGVTNLTNYEAVREGNVDPRLFRSASLDEASVLRSYGSKTFQTFLPLFAETPFRFVATATPSPNRYKELIHYAGYLGVMDTGQALTRFFQRDSKKAGNLTLYPHKEEEFWLWVSSWALFIQKPSDLGFSDEGYEMPPLTVRWHEVTAAAEPVDGRDGQQEFLPARAKGLVEASREKRGSIGARVAKLCEILEADPAPNRIIWHDLEDERRAIEAAVPAAVSVYGTQDLEAREEAIRRFSDGWLQYLSAKPVLAGSGCNFQKHCHKAVFLGVGYKFNDFIQAIYRIQRFLQRHGVEIDIIHTEAEAEVRRELEEKWRLDTELRARMSEIIRRYGLSQLAMAETLTRSIGVTRVEARGEGWPNSGWQVANNDCTLETRRMAESSLDQVITSIPFSNHYEYTPSYNDFGHTEGDEHFFAQMDHLTPELLRALKPGRLACIHVKDRILFGAVTGEGVPTVNPFHAKCIFHYQKHGFQYLGMHVVLTDVVRENNATYRLGYSEMCKDSTKMGTGSPEYVLLFRKPQTERGKGYADERVSREKADYSLMRWQTDAGAFWRSSGQRLLNSEEMAGLEMATLMSAWKAEDRARVYDFAHHIRLGEGLDFHGRLPTTFAALPATSWSDWIWDDVNRLATLNGAQASAGREKHICLARGSLVLTHDGYRPIEDIAVGDLVLTHKGRWRPVTVKRNTGVRPIVELRAQGVAGLRLTPEHQLWARRVRDLAWARSHSRQAAMRAVPEWARADVLAGSYVNLKLPPVKSSTLSDSEWWIIGRWLGDGHRDVRGGLHISCGHQEANALAGWLGDRAGAVTRGRTGYQITVKDRGGRLRAVIDRCGRGAAGKGLPGEALGLDPIKAGRLLDGYLSADGHFVDSRRRWTASSVSRQLLLGMAMLAQRAHGAVASVYAGRPGGPAVIEGRVVATRPDWVLSFDLPHSSRPKGQPFLIDDGAWKKVRAVDDAGEAETWCLRVEEDESFTAEGCIVKNCPLQFDIVDRLIERYSMPGELIYDPFGGLFTVPLRALKLGRRGCAAELNPDYFRDGVNFLKAAEEAVDVPTLFDVIAAEEATRVPDRADPPPDYRPAEDEAAAEAVQADMPTEDEALAALRVVGAVYVGRWPDGGWWVPGKASLGAELEATRFLELDARAVGLAAVLDKIRDGEAA